MNPSPKARPLLAATALLGAATMLAPHPARAVGDRAFVGINNNTGFITDPTYVARSIAADNDLGVGSARVGMDDIGGRNVGLPFSWTKRDATIESYHTAKIQIRATMSPRLMIDRDADPVKWRANWRYFASNVMAHYKGRVFYYIIDNEPDVDYGNGKLTAQESFDLCKIAFEEARKIDPRIQIESPPPAAPDSQIMKEMIALDIGSVCDVIGMHAYGGQIDETVLGRPWEWLTEFKTTRKPLVISESGAIDPWFKTGAQGRREWFDKFYVQLKRYGYSHVMLYNLDNQGDWELLQTSLEKTAEFEATPAYTAIKEGYRMTPANALNGGFEAINDPRYDWYPYVVADKYELPHWANFSASGAHTGRNCLQIALAPQATHYVRRVVGPLVPGRTYTLQAWAKPENGASATLAADGTQPLYGDRSFSEKSSKDGAWQQLSVSFVPTNPWVVISLEGSNALTAQIDDQTKTDAALEVKEGDEANGKIKREAQDKIRDITRAASAGVRWDDVTLR